MIKTIIYCHNVGGEKQTKEYNNEQEQALIEFNNNYKDDYTIDKVEEIVTDDSKDAMEKIKDRVVNWIKEPTKKEYIKQLEEENQELKAENVELRKFAEYVRSLKTHEDFNKLRNVILTINKKFK